MAVTSSPPPPRSRSPSALRASCSAARCTAGRRRHGQRPRPPPRSRRAPAPPLPRRRRRHRRRPQAGGAGWWPASHMHLQTCPNSHVLARRPARPAGRSRRRRGANQSTSTAVPPAPSPRPHRSRAGPLAGQRGRPRDLRRRGAIVGSPPPPNRWRRIADAVELIPGAAHACTRDASGRVRRSASIRAAAPATAPRVPRRRRRRPRAPATPSRSRPSTPHLHVAAQQRPFVPGRRTDGPARRRHAGRPRGIDPHAGLGRARDRCARGHDLRDRTGEAFPADPTATPCAAVSPRNRRRRDVEPPRRRSAERVRGGGERVSCRAVGLSPRAARVGRRHHGARDSAAMNSRSLRP
ncbi:hypothetical protein NAEX_00997 [Nannocystis exedens]|nr:hypothetical protein NAEX_00997 [Nannocystis exedens]